MSVVNQLNAGILLSCMIVSINLTQSFFVQMLG